MPKSEKNDGHDPIDYKTLGEPKNYGLAKPLFWILIVFGMIIGGGTLLISIFLSTISETVGTVGEASSATTGFWLMLLGAAIIADCYILTKGIEPARLVYGVLMGIESLLVLALLMTGIIDLAEYPELGIALFVLLIPLIWSCVVMPTSKGIKEYMYGLEVEKVDKRGRR